MIDSTKTVELRVEQDPQFGDGIPTTAFLKLLTEWSEALRQATIDAGETGKPLAWVIRGISMASPAVVVHEAVTTTPEEVLTAQVAVRDLVVGLNTARDGGDPREVLTAATAQHVERMVKLVADGVSAGFAVASGELSADVVTVVPSASVRLLYTRAIGSVDGVVVAVAFASAPVFTVRDWLTNELVVCHFDPARFKDQIGNALLRRRRVTVSGRLTERFSGESVRLSEVDAVYVYPDDLGLPQPDEMMGRYPDFTDGLPAEDWVRMGRE